MKAISVSVTTLGSDAFQAPRHAGQKYFVWIALVVLCSGCQASEMVRFTYDNATSTHSWTTADRETTVPFTMVDTHIILPVRVNGSEPLSFVLDSGAGATVVLESRHTRTLQLKSSGEITVSGVGDGPDPAAYSVRDTNVALGSLVLEAQSVIQLPFASVPFFKDLDDVYFDSVVGAPFFQRFRVAIDYDNQLVTFSEPSVVSELEKPGRTWQTLPLEIAGGVPYVTAQVANDRGDLVDVKLLADTGARGAVSLTLETSNDLYAPQSYFTSIDQGLSGDVISRVALSDSIALGQYTLTTLPIGYAMSGGESEGGSNGILGNEILSRFNLVFDYAKERLLLSPNQRFSAPLTADRSGLMVRPHLMGGIVRSIAPGSGASDSALQVGDIITSYDGSQVSTQTVGELKRALSAEVDSLSLCWQRGKNASCESIELSSRFPEG